MANTAPMPSTLISAPLYSIITYYSILILLSNWHLTFIRGQKLEIYSINRNIGFLWLITFTSYETPIPYNVAYSFIN